MNALLSQGRKCRVRSPSPVPWPRSPTGRGVRLRSEMLRVRLPSWSLKMKRRYSGPKSKKFWKRINKLQGPQMLQAYALRVELQNLKHKVLMKLKEIENTLT